jgi:hypothetical protein
VITVLVLSFPAAAAYEVVPDAKVGEIDNPLVSEIPVRAEVDEDETITEIFIVPVAVTESVAVIVAV